MFYNWKFGDFTPNVYKRDTFHVYANPYTHFINFSDWNTCNTAYSIDTIVASTVNVVNQQHFVSPSISIFPNPANESIAIILMSTDLNKTNLRISNPFGQTLFENDYNLNVGKNELKIDTSGFLSGMYFISLKNQVLKSQIKLLVEHH